MTTKKMCNDVRELELAMSYVADECKLSMPVEVTIERLGNEPRIRVEPSVTYMLHRLWTMCVGKHGYDKQAWSNVDRQLSCVANMPAATIDAVCYDCNGDKFQSEQDYCNRLHCPTCDGTGIVVNRVGHDVSGEHAVSATDTNGDGAIEQGLHVIVSGNIIDGITLIGPFESCEYANEYGDAYRNKVGDFVVAELETPSDDPDTAQKQLSCQRLGVLVLEYFAKAGDDEINGGDLVDAITDWKLTLGLS